MESQQFGGLVFRVLLWVSVFLCIGHVVFETDNVCKLLCASGLSGAFFRLLRFFVFDIAVTV